MSAMLLRQYANKYRSDMLKRLFETTVTPKPTVATAVANPIALMPHQSDIKAVAKRFNVISCGRRFGKTTFGEHIVIECALRGLPAAWFAPTYKTLYEVWREVKKVTADFTARVSVQEKQIELKTGGIIDFWSLDNEDSGRGRKYAEVVIDEAGLIRNLEYAWQNTIRPALADYKGRAWFPGTPKGMNFFHDLSLKSKSNAKEWTFFQFPTATNPLIDASEIEAARADLPELVFQQEFLAQFVEQSGTLVKREHLRYGEIPEGLALFAGVDLAISQKEGADYTAVAILGQSADGVIYIVDVCRERLNFNGALSFIQSLCERWQVKEVLIEQTQYQAAAVQELLRRTTLNVRGVRPDKDKVTRFQSLQARYEQGFVVHSRDLPPAFEKELLAFPNGEHDDMVDACVYAYAALRGKREIRLLDI